VSTHKPYICKFTPTFNSFLNNIQRKPPSSSNPPIERADRLDFPEEVELFLRLRPAPSDELIPDVCVLLILDDDFDFFFFFFCSTLEVLGAAANRSTFYNMVEPKMLI
jgi:hypothetical protein